MFTRMTPETNQKIELTVTRFLTSFLANFNFCKNRFSKLDNLIWKVWSISRKLVSAKIFGKLAIGKIGII